MQVGGKMQLGDARWPGVIKNITGATIGYKLRVAITICVTICDYHQKQTKNNRIASLPRN